MAIMLSVLANRFAGSTTGCCPNATADQNMKNTQTPATRFMVTPLRPNEGRRTRIHHKAGTNTKEKRSACALPPPRFLEETGVLIPSNNRHIRSLVLPALVQTGRE